MRSGTGTKSGEPVVVTFSTKATMACFAAVSFQEGKGSAASALAAINASTHASMVARKLGIRMAFMVAILQKRPHPMGRVRPGRSSQQFIQAWCQLPPWVGVWSDSSTRSSEKLPAFWLGGNSLNVARKFPMYCCAGTITNARSMIQRV